MSFLRWDAKIERVRMFAHNKTGSSHACSSKPTYTAKKIGGKAGVSPGWALQRPPKRRFRTPRQLLAPVSSRVKRAICAPKMAW
jgi:hypothetical protein